MNSFPDECLLFESYQLYIIAKYKASDCSKLRPDLPHMFFASSQWNQRIFRSSYFWIHVTTWAASTLWQYCCKTRCPLKNICYRVRIYCNANFKIFKCKYKCILQWCVLNHRGFPAITDWLLLWCF